MSLITIAIPFYNAEKFLTLAIESVLNQTYKDWKLVLVNDGSSDSSLTIAEKFAYQDDRIKVFSDGANKNLGYRLNQIPNLVSTKYLARMDADDIMHPERIEKQISILEADSSIDVLGTNAYSIDENGAIQGIRFLFASTQRLAKVRSFIHPTIIAKTSWFKKNKYDALAERIEDEELWIRTAEHSNFQILTEPLLFYREFGFEYYKKYLKGIPSIFYVFKKHKFTLRVLKFGFKYFFSCFVYYFFNIFNQEEVLIKRRNKVKIKDIRLNNSLNF
jgi:glycosyltransferase involved in cell wall biosynthesis